MYFLIYGNATVLFCMLVTFGLPILVRVLANPWFICRHPWFYPKRFSPSATVGFCAHGARMRGWGSGLHRNYYGAWFNVKNQGPIPGPSPALGLQGTVRSSSVYHELVLPPSVIAICPLIQPCICEVGSSIFSAMSRIKFASSTRASLPSMPLPEITNV